MESRPWGKATKILAEHGIEVPPGELEAMVRGWIAKCRERAPKETAAMTDVEVLELFAQAVREKFVEKYLDDAKGAADADRP